jgi:pimeloyl-ACP methyl ester carboxylesterase
MPDLGEAGNEQSLDEYAALVVDAILQTGRQVILVGHSMGGLVISQVAEKIPQYLSALVYVCGLMLVNAPYRKTYSLDLDHSPFLSDPMALLVCLKDVAANGGKGLEYADHA